MRFHTDDNTECQRPGCELEHHPYGVYPKGSKRLGGCPCEHVEPCQNVCSCAYPFMSGGCSRCAMAGSTAQQFAAAKRLAGLLDTFSEYNSTRLDTYPCTNHPERRTRVAIDGVYLCPECATESVQDTKKG